MTTTCERPVFSRLDADPPSVRRCAELLEQVKELRAELAAKDGVIKELSDTLKRRQSEAQAEKDSLIQRIGTLEQRLRTNGISDK